MLKLTRWCIAHRRYVVAGWVALAVLGMCQLMPGSPRASSCGLDSVLMPT